MTRKSHQAVAVTTALILNLPVLPALIASTLPDIDVKWQRKKGGLLFSHRGITHHFIFTILLIISVFYIDLPPLEKSLYTSFVVGYTSHIFADIMTVSGVPYWTNKDRFSLKLFKTGSPQETTFVLALIGIVIGITIYKNGIWSIIPYEGKLISSFISSLTN